jgi:hypothetical protein
MRRWVDDRFHPPSHPPTHAPHLLDGVVSSVLYSILCWSPRCLTSAGAPTHSTGLSKVCCPYQDCRKGTTEPRGEGQVVEKSTFLEACKLARTASKPAFFLVAAAAASLADTVFVTCNSRA